MSRQQGVIQSPILILQALQESVLADRQFSLQQLIIGPGALLLECIDFGRQAAFETQGFALSQRKPSALVESRRGEESMPTQCDAKGSYGFCWLVCVEVFHWIGELPCRCSPLYTAASFKAFEIRSTMPRHSKHNSIYRIGLELPNLELRHFAVTSCSSCPSSIAPHPPGRVSPPYAVLSSCSLISVWTP